MYGWVLTPPLLPVPARTEKVQPRSDALPGGTQYEAKRPPQLVPKGKEFDHGRFGWP